MRVQYVYSTCKLSREEEERKAKVIAVLLATDPRSDDDESGGVRISVKFNEFVFSCATRGTSLTRAKEVRRC